MTIKSLTCLLAFKHYSKIFNYCTMELELVGKFTLYFIKFIEWNLVFLIVLTSLLMDWCQCFQAYKTAKRTQTPDFPAIKKEKGPIRSGTANSEGCVSDLPNSLCWFFASLLWVMSTVWRTRLCWWQHRWKFWGESQNHHNRRHRIAYTPARQLLLLLLIHFSHVRLCATP